MSKHRRKFSAKTKDETVCRHIVGGVASETLARELGVHSAEVEAWVDRRTVVPNRTKFEQLRKQFELTQAEIWQTAGYPSATQYNRMMGQKSGTGISFGLLSTLVRALSELGVKDGKSDVELDPRDFVRELSPQKSLIHALSICVPTIPLVKAPRFFLHSLHSNGEAIEQSHSERKSNALSLTTSQSKERNELIPVSHVVVDAQVPRGRRHYAWRLGTVLLCLACLVLLFVVQIDGDRKSHSTNLDSKGTALRDFREPFVEVAELNAEEADLYLEMVGKGKRYWQTGNYEHAALCFKEAIAIKDTSVEIAIAYADGVRLSPQNEDYAKRVSQALGRLDSWRAKLSDIDSIVHLQVAQGRLLSAMGMQAEAVLISNEALETLESPSMAGSGNLALYCDIAEVFFLSGNRAAAEKILDRAIDLSEILPSQEWGAHWCKALLAWMRSAEDSTGIDDIDNAIQWSKGQRLPNHRTIAHLLFFKAEMLETNDRIPEAKAAITEAIKWADNVNVCDKRARSIWGIRLASILIHESQTDPTKLALAKDEINSSIGWQESQLPRDERTIAVMRSTLVNCLLQGNELESALAQIDKSIEWGESQIEQNPSLLSQWYFQRAAVYRWIVENQDGLEKELNLKNAFADIERSLSISKSLASKRDICMALNLRAALRRICGENQLALRDLEDAENEIDDKMTGNDLLLNTIRQRKQALITLLDSRKQ